MKIKLGPLRVPQSKLQSVISGSTSLSTRISNLGESTCLIHSDSRPPVRYYASHLATPSAWFSNHWHVPGAPSGIASVLFQFLQIATDLNRSSHKGINCTVTRSM